jgi:hypothetical protein
MVDRRELVAESRVEQPACFQLFMVGLAQGIALAPCSEGVAAKEQ